MDCSEFGQMLDRYEELTDFEKQLLEDHCALCPKCADELDFYKSTTAVLNNLPALKAPESFILDINKRIDQIQKPKITFAAHIRKYAYRYGAAAACVALLAVVGVNNSDLVNKMIHHDDGIISEVISTQAPSKDDAVVPVIKSTQAPLSETPQPTQNANPAVVSEPPKQTAKPTAKPKAAGEIKPSKTKVPSTKTVVRQQATSAPKKETNAPVMVTQAPSTPVPAPTSAPPVPTQDTSSDSSYTFDNSKYYLPNEPQAQSNDTETNAYSRSSGDPSQWAAVSTTLNILSKDEERVMELIDIYTSDKLGDQYMIDSERMEYMLDVFKQEGIVFNDSARSLANSADGDMMFTLIIS